MWITTGVRAAHVMYVVFPDSTAVLDPVIAILEERDVDAGTLWLIVPADVVARVRERLERAGLPPRFAGYRTYEAGNVHVECW